MPKKRKAGKPPLDLRGRRFGRLKAVRRRRDGRWVCACDCGNETIVTRGALRSGHTRSCGCLRRDRASRTGRRNLGAHHGQLVTVDGKALTVSDWAKESRLKDATIRARLSKGWDPRRAVREPTTSPATWTRLSDERLMELLDITIERLDDGAVRHALSILVGELANRYVRISKRKG